MAMYKQYNLPFEIERACRCSFVVRIDNGEPVFITNENLLYMMEHPDANFQIVERCNSHGFDSKWIEVAKTEWTLGFKNRIFGPDGMLIR